MVPLLSANSRRWTIPEDATAGMVRPSAVLPEPVDGVTSQPRTGFLEIPRENTSRRGSRVVDAARVCRQCSELSLHFMRTVVVQRYELIVSL